MIIVYVEESPRRARSRMDSIARSLVPVDSIKKMGRRTIELKTGINFRVFTRQEIEDCRLRGLNIAAAFVNCELPRDLIEAIKYQVRIGGRG